jgi:hypothetical protein
MSAWRQTNGSHGCVISPQKVCHHLTVEQWFSRCPRRGLVPTYKHQILRLTWERIHWKYTRVCGPLIVGRGSIRSKSNSKQLILCQKTLPLPLLQHWWSGKQCATGMTVVSRYVRPIFRDAFVYETALCGCY